MHSTVAPHVESLAPSTAAQNGPPLWDAQRRELQYGGELVKRYRVQARNQQLVLDAFQEDGWPACIDDPLPPHGDQTPQDRLHATIKSLNGCQTCQRIKFHANGTGRQIFWEIRTPPPAPKPRRRKRSRTKPTAK